MTEPRIILWDNDGVLVETEHLYFEATREVLQSVGVDLDQDQYLELFLRQGRGAWHLAEERGVPAETVEVLKVQRNELYASRLRTGARVLDGVVETLARLRPRFAMGVVTSSRRDHFDLIHERSGLRAFFDFVVASGDYPRSKPHPDPYLAAIARAGVPASACVAVEDSERGLDAAREAGVRCFVIPTALTRTCRFAGAERVLERIEQVADLLGD